MLIGRVHTSGEFKMAPARFRVLSVQGAPAYEFALTVGFDVVLRK